MVTVCHGRPAVPPTSCATAVSRQPATQRRPGRRAVALLAFALLACLLTPAASASAGPAATPPADPLALLAVQQAQLLAFDGAANDYFGYSVALSGETALVGAVGDTVGGNARQGSAYVFVRSGGSWIQQAHLMASDGAAYDNFGHSVALSGETALVGAPDDTIGGNVEQGSVYVFVRSGGSWSQQAQLFAFDGAAGDYFGSSVALSGETALVGAQNDTVGSNTYQGSAYVFVRSGGSWSQQAQLFAFDGAAGDYFGYSVALSGETALVGARADTVGSNTLQGSAYVFARSGTGWSQQAKLLAGDGAAGDYFGYSVALSGWTALVGAHFDTVGSNARQGSAYVFQLDTTPPLTTASGLPAGWSRAPVTLTLSAADDPGGSGMTGGLAKTEYQIDSGAWTTGTSCTISGDAIHTIGYRSTDAAGNTEAAKSATVKIDGTPPATTASGLDGLWHNNAVTVGLTGNDALSGPAGTSYSLDGGAAVPYTGSLTISTPGNHTLSYFSTDVAGNVEAAKSATVKIDTGKPTSTATRNVSVKKGKKARLSFRVSDPAPSCGAARVTITIKLKKKTVKTIKIANVATNKARSYAFKVTLKKGSYSWTVKATDIAGNVGKLSAARKLTVR
jgi:hypothetical protein